ncbi:MAG: deoxynucleoside kinase [Candidatus Marinimicrobia bacterium]|nr:deoxynucleoside kinase [Candidatus Neomarinimicrobiota bacterium]
MKTNPFVGLAGNIGVGKTTFTKITSTNLGWAPYYESVDDNPYLGDFYADMSRWSFNLQIYFLHKRFQAHFEMSHSNGGVIQDRTIYEDVEIFARNLFQMGFMNDRDWANYRDLFKVMTSYLRKPDLIIYLKASTDTLLTRIAGRSRDYEKTIDPEYLHSLNVAYNRWVDSIDDIPVFVIETDRFNIFEDEKKLDFILNEIKKRLS